MKYILNLCLVGIMVMMAACEGPSGPEGVQGEQGIAGPVLTGNLTGFVQLQDKYGNSQKLTDTVKVTIEGTKSSTICDSVGRWKFDTLKTGTYTFVFSKPGYGTYKKIGYQFVGGDTALFGITNLAKIPTDTVTSLTVSSDTVAIFISGAISPSSVSSTQYTYVQIFLGNDSLVSSNPAHYLFMQASPVNPSSTIFSTSISKEMLAAAGFSSGKAIYGKAYVTTFLFMREEGGYYTDIKTGRYIYPSVAVVGSPVDSTLVP